LNIGRTRAMFVIHEDLLCLHSPFFREKLQPRRREIEGDCSICHEELSPGVKELTFCSDSCGCNFHYDCVEQWKAQTAQGEITRCPLCRSDWDVHRVSQYSNFRSLDKDAFEIYSTWLYNGHIATEEDEDEVPEYSVLAKTYQFAVHVQDTTFSRLILETIVELFSDTDYYPSTAAIRIAYTNSPINCQLKKLIVCLYMLFAKAELFEGDDNEAYPIAFACDLTAALLKQHPRGEGPEGLEDLKAHFFPREPGAELQIDEGFVEPA
jgi:hypothetical protein